MRAEATLASKKAALDELDSRRRAPAQINQVECRRGSERKAAYELASINVQRADVGGRGASSAE